MENVLRENKNNSIDNQRLRKNKQIIFDYLLCNQIKELRFVQQLTIKKTNYENNN